MTDGPADGPDAAGAGAADGGTTEGRSAGSSRSRGRGRGVRAALDRARESPRGLAVLAVVAGVATLAVAGLAVADVATGPPSGQAILEDARERYDRADSVTGTAVVTATNGTATRTATVEFAAADPDRTAVTVRYRNGTYAAGTNGTVAWVSAPELGIVRQWQVGELEAAVENHSNYSHGAHGDAAWATEGDYPRNWSEANVTATRVGSETIRGVETHVVELTHDDPEVTATATVWVAVDSSKVLRAQVVDGDRRVTVDVREVRFDVSVHESTFAPPDDRRVTDLSVDRYDEFDAAQSASSIDLPAADGQFLGAAASDYRGDPVVVQRYAGVSADGGDGNGGQGQAGARGNLTVLSTTADGLPLPEDGREVSLGETTATVVELGDATGVVWTDDGVTHAVIADRPDESLVAVAEDLA